MSEKKRRRGPEKVRRPLPYHPDFLAITKAPGRAPVPPEVRPEYVNMLIRVAIQTTPENRRKIDAYAARLGVMHEYYTTGVKLMERDRRHKAQQLLA